MNYRSFRMEHAMIICLLLSTLCPSVTEGRLTGDAPPGKPMRPGTDATGGVSNMALVYLDSRSLGMGSDWGMNATRYLPLLREADLTSSYEAGETNGAVATPSQQAPRMFDTFLLIGYIWTGGKCFWPGQCPNQMNETDWNEIWDLWSGVQGIEGMETSTRDSNISSTTVYVTVPYPDQLQEKFGYGGGDRLLNFSIAEDRVAATAWWVNKVIAHFEQKQYQHVKLGGFYWFLEEMTPTDASVVQQLAHHIASQNSSYVFAGRKQKPLFTWIPYYYAALRKPYGVAQWRELGFDWVTIQPNFAFDPCGLTRFEHVNELMVNFTTGVEMEMPLYSRNKKLHDNSTTSFYDYVWATKHYRWDTDAVKTFYETQAFLEMASKGSGSQGNATLRGMYQSLAKLIRGE